MGILEQGYGVEEVMMVGEGAVKQINTSVLKFPANWVMKDFEELFPMFSELSTHRQIYGCVTELETSVGKAVWFIQVLKWTAY